MRPVVPNASSTPFDRTVIESELNPGVRYRLERALGQGGTAIAYFATRLAPDGESPAVVKVILPRIVAESGDIALTIVKKEAVALGRLNEQAPPTPYVVRLMDTGGLPYDYFTKQLVLPWIALEYVHGGIEGTTLEERVDYSVRATGYAFDPERASRVIMSLAKGLAEIHAVGVIHRDLTPGNVLCCGSGDSELYKISDFGIARPAGLTATFGDAIVGTPGFVAPEQLGGSAPIGPESDIFSFGAIIYFVLSGQRYFEVTSPTQALLAVGSPARRSLFESPTLSPELREREAACQALDLALARATSPNVADRPKSALFFAQSLIPWLGGDSTHARPSRRWTKSLEMFQVPEEPEGTSWSVRHPPGDDRLLTSVAWNGSGHCLAVSTMGLVYWDGTRWVAVPARGLESLGEVRMVRRLTPTSWLLGGSTGEIAEYSREGVRHIARLPDANWRLIDTQGDLGDLAVLAVNQPSAGPALIGAAAGRFMKPVIARGAALISAIARIDDLRWLVAGRASTGRAYAAIFRPLELELEPIAVPNGRALVAAASRPDRRLALAVGADGAILRVERDRVEAENVDGSPDFAAVAIDVLGSEWAAGAGSVWSNRLRRGWTRVWDDASWRPPFISVLAETDLVMAVTVDSGVLECRTSQPTTKQGH